MCELEEEIKKAPSMKFVILFMLIQDISVSATRNKHFENDNSIKVAELNLAYFDTLSNMSKESSVDLICWMPRIKIGGLNLNIYTV